MAMEEALPPVSIAITLREFTSQLGGHIRSDRLDLTILHAGAHR
jgi:hypothetical protein